MVFPWRKAFLGSLGKKLEFRLFVQHYLTKNVEKSFCEMNFCFVVILDISEKKSSVASFWQCLFLVWLFVQLHMMKNYEKSFCEVNFCFVAKKWISHKIRANFRQMFNFGSFGESRPITIEKCGQILNKGYFWNFYWKHKMAKLKRLLQIWRVITALVMPLSVICMLSLHVWVLLISRNQNCN